MIFQTLDGLQVPTLTVEQMREADRIAASETGPALADMMEMAGEHLGRFITSQWPRVVGVGPVIVLAGGGHNGGGGICTAYHLASQAIDVRLCLSVAEDRLAEATAAQLKRFKWRGGQVLTVDELRETAPFLIMDALIGYSLKGTPHGLAAELINWANQSPAPVVSLDIPSGLNANSGEATSCCIYAEKTVTLAMPKPGLAAVPVGELWLADIGIGDAAYEKMGIRMQSPFAGAPYIRLHVRRKASPVIPGMPL